MTVTLLLICADSVSASDKVQGSYNDVFGIDSGVGDWTESVDKGKQMRLISVAVLEAVM